MICPPGSSVGVFDTGGRVAVEPFGQDRVSCEEPDQDCRPQCEGAPVRVRVDPNYRSGEEVAGQEDMSVYERVPPHRGVHQAVYVMPGRPHSN